MMEVDGVTETAANGNPLGQCLASYMDQGISESHRYFLSRRTLLEMLHDRGYVVSTADLSLSLEDFRETYGPNPDIERLRIVSVHRSDPSKRTMAIFCGPGAVNVNVIRSISAMVVNKETLTSLILVLQSEITSQAMKAVELWPFKVEIFQITDLLVNITKHVLKPKHEVLTDAARISEVRTWLASQFEAAGKEVPEFELNSRSIAHLYNLATISQAKTQAANIVAADFRQKVAEYRSQAARIREILESAGLAQESLASNVVASAHALANVANLLNIRDTEMSSFLIAMGDISLRKTSVEEKRAKVEKDSKVLLDYTRKAIARLSYLKRTLIQLEEEIAPCELQMENWKTTMEVMAFKEKQYAQQSAKCKAALNRAGYTPEISHGVLVEMAEHRKDLEKKTKPIQDTLRSYQDLPPDKALAALAIEDKMRQYAAAEKYLENVLQSLT